MSGTIRLKFDLGDSGTLEWTFEQKWFHHLTPETVKKQLLVFKQTHESNVAEFFCLLLCLAQYIEQNPKMGKKRIENALQSLINEFS